MLNNNLVLFYSIEIHHSPVIYCTALKNVDDRKWEFINYNLNFKKTEIEMNMIAAALSCTRNPEQLEHYLMEYVVENKPLLNPSYKQTIVTFICQNPIGYDVLYNVLWSHLYLIKKR